MQFFPNYTKLQISHHIGISCSITIEIVLEIRIAYIAFNPLLYAKHVDMIFFVVFNGLPSFANTL